MDFLGSYSEPWDACFQVFLWTVVAAFVQWMAERLWIKGGREQVEPLRSGCISRETLLGLVIAQITFNLGGMRPIGYIGLRWHLSMPHPICLNSVFPISLNHFCHSDKGHCASGTPAFKRRIFSRLPSHQLFSSSWELPQFHLFSPWPLPICLYPSCYLRL